MFKGKLPRNEAHDSSADEIARLLRIEEAIRSSIEHAFIILDPDGRVLEWLGGAFRIFDYTAAEMRGQSFARLFTPEDIANGIPETELKTAASNAAAEDDRWLIRKDGSLFWATGVVRPIRGEQGELLGFAKLLRDRTDQKAQMEALRNQLIALRRTDEHKNVFLATLSHELRNPLAPLVNAIHLLRVAGSDPATIAETSKIIERQVEIMRRLVDDLLDVTRIGAGKVQLNNSQIVLQDVIKRAVETGQSLIRQARHELYVAMPEGEMLVFGDADRLQQVFVNLINNAAKYTPSGGRIWVKATTEGREAAVHIEDSGVGIAPEMLPQIFDLFTQVESASAQSQGGLGIGLALVKQLVTLHGGSVQVRSEGLGKGSVFTVRLPLIEERAPSSA